MFETNDVVDVALRIMEARTCHDLEIFFVTMWSIWYNRNQVAHEAQGSSSIHIWGTAQQALNDYNIATTINFLRQQPPKVGWSAPPSGLHKINVDGATFEDGRPSDVGVVIRDCKGVIVATSAKVLPTQYSVEVTKALAVEQGILLARQKMLSQVILESNSLSVVDAISSNSPHGELQPIIQGILLLSFSFDIWKVKHLRREYNKVAHELAKLARETRMSLGMAIFARPAGTWPDPTLMVRILPSPLGIESGMGFKIKNRSESRSGSGSGSGFIKKIRNTARI